MYFVYAIKSKIDNLFYTGFTDNLERRLSEHNLELQRATKHRIPFEIIYFEGCVNKQDALNREKYLKSGLGKRYLKLRLKNFLT
jgi:putative endonuclease